MKSQQIVCQYHGNTCEHDPKVQRGAGEDLGWGLQKPQHRGNGQLAGQHQDGAAERGEDRRTADGPAEGIVLLCAELLGHQDAEALGQTAEYTQHQPVQPVGGTQGCQSTDLQCFAHHHGIYHGIHLLEDVAHHQGQGEGYNQRKGAALRHGLDSGMIQGIPSISGGFGENV